MLTSETFPAVADVERYGNLSLSAWSPPSHQSLADGWMEAVIDALHDSPCGFYLLGHRPGNARSLPRDAIPRDIQSLLDGLASEAERSPLYRIRTEVAASSKALLRSGDIHIRHRRTDDSTRSTRVESTHLCRVLALTSVADALQAIQETAAAAPLQVTLSCIADPHAGLRQPEARGLRSIRNWTGDVVAITWLGTSIDLLAGREALLRLRVDLLTWLSASANEA